MRQSDVAQFIRNIEPGVAQSPSPRFQKVNETIYTQFKKRIWAYANRVSTLTTPKRKCASMLDSLLQEVRAAMNAAASKST